MSILLKVVRDKFHSDWTLGKLYLNDIHDGYTVEDEIRDVKVKGETAIPYGTYELGSRYSPKFSSSYLWSDTAKMLIDTTEYNLNKKTYSNLNWREHELIWVKNVPNFEYVLIHWGNTDLDTEGCLIIGKNRGMVNNREGVITSRAYYVDFYRRVYPAIKYSKEKQYIQYSHY